MKYVLLIYDDQDVWAAMSEEESNATHAEYMAYSQELAKAGAMVGGDALQSTATATTVRVRDGQTLSTDGPFAETKEQLGGYYLIDVEHLDEALAWAAKIPSARFGSIEVRPLADMSGPPEG
jgi:hypothetical protein